MTQPGGAATVNGVLYQVLGTAHWAAHIRIRAKVENEELSEAQLIIEPQLGGGDVRIEGLKSRIVEQWKAKTDEGTWSLRKVIDEVFPDLIRAVAPAEDRTPTTFRFVTAGRRGRWGYATDLLLELQSQPTPLDPITALDDSKAFTFFPGETLTRRAFFLHIVTRLRTHPDIAAEPTAETCRKLWCLLANFEMAEGRVAASVRDELDHLLLGVVDYRDQLDAKRRELCGLVLELASQGNITISPAEFLRRAGIGAISLTNWVQIREKQLRLVRRHISTVWRYNDEEDVRDTPDWPNGKSVLVLSGESGQGKTWQLSSLALRVFSSNGLAVTVTATGDANDDITLAARMLWQDNIEHDTELTLDRLSRRRCDVVPGVSDPWLTVFIDDVINAGEARNLVLRTDWETLGVRLAISTSPPIARSLKHQFPDRVHTIHVKDFSTDELRRYLDRRGQDWGHVAPDVRHTLHRPLLAKLYCDVAGTTGWQPTCEYDLYEQCWNRIRDDRDQANHPHDLDCLRELAATLLDANTAYPWSRQTLETSGVSSEMQVRLEVIGWLRRLDDSRVEIWHHRLLNWAVAEALVSRRQSGVLTTAQLGAKLVEMDAPQTNTALQWLGYVPMDVLWMLGNPVLGLTGELPVLIELLESAGPFAGYPESLFEKQLPTLGERAIEAMIARVRATTEHEWNPYPRFCANAIVKIGEPRPELASRWGLKLIADDCPELREVGMRVLSRHPDKSALDRLWELHKLSVNIYEQKEGERYWDPYKSSFAALRACVRLNPRWLAQCIAAIDAATEPASELAFLVASLGGQMGKMIWQESKDLLFAKIPPHKSRSLGRCICEYQDTDEISRLESWLDQKDDAIASTTLQALATIAPAEALEGLSHLTSWDLYATRNWWLPELMLRCPQETNIALLALMRERHEELWTIADVFQDAPNDMDIGTIDFLLDELDRLVSDYLENPPTDNRIPLWHPLMLLASVTRHDLIQRFEMQAGAPLEERLVQVACSWVGRMGNCVDHELVYSTRVLLMIGGDGFTQLISCKLLSTNKHSRRDGIEWATVRPTGDSRRQLVAISQNSEFWDDQKFPFEQCNASVALALLGENRATIDCVLRWGIVSGDLASARWSMPPMSDSDLTDAIAVMENGDDGARTNALRALSISGRRDLVPKVREILQSAVPDSELAQAAVVALWHLRDSDPATVELLTAQLAVPSHRHQANLALLANGGVAGLNALEASLQQTGVTPGNETDILALNLFRREATRRTAATEIWKAFQTNGFHFGSSSLIECLGELDLPDVRDVLLNEACPPEGTFHFVGRRTAAIRALSKLDREAAFHAAETALIRANKDRDQLPSLLMEIDEQRAIPLLCDNCVHERSALVNWATGRALRHATESVCMQEQLHGMFRVDDADVRVAACEISGWQSSETFHAELRKCVLDDLSFDVRHAGMEALQRSRNERHLKELLLRLKDAAGIRVWSYLEAVLDLGDPILLTNLKDPLWLGTALPDGYVHVWQHIEPRIKKRIDELNKKAADADKQSD